MVSTPKDPSPTEKTGYDMPLAGKTVFLVDRAEYFSKVSSHHSINGDCLKDQHKNNLKHINCPTIEPFKKSLWTCSIEAVVEYSRLVWDLFPNGERAISIISSSACSNDSKHIPEPDKSLEIICDWSEDQQNLNHLMRSLARSKHQINSPIEPLKHTIDISEFSNSDGKNFIHSLNKAFDLLCLPTPVQIRGIVNKNDQRHLLKIKNNRGRLILVSSFRDNSCIESLIKCAKELIEKKCESIVQKYFNAPGSSKSKPKTDLASSPSDEWPISHCELLILNTFPLDDQGPTSKIEESELTQISPYLSVIVSSVKSGRSLAGKLSNYCLQHYNLRSTTITGIPMKEEQNASSSSNYDVEIMHCSSAHDDLTKSGNPIFEGVVNEKFRHGFPYKSYTLRWCTPRSNNVELYHCIATSRITSVDVNSRPSSCLTNFLLNGRAVMLEIYKSKSSRMTSHMLASHNGELFIHTLSTANHKLNFDDPPSILDGFGGKVQDYRTAEFNEFMKRNLLTACKTVEGGRKETIYPINKALNLIKRQTLYWPLTLGHTLIYNIQPQLARLLTCVPKDSLSIEDVIECKKNIYEILKLENEAVALIPPTIPSLVKSPSGPSRGGQTKLNNLYKLLWNELEYFIRINSTTPEHEAILECLTECRSSDKKQSFDKKESKNAKRSNKSVKTADTDLNSIEEPSTKKLKHGNHQLIPNNIGSINPELLTHYKSGLSLLQTWASLYDRAHRNKTRPEFYGRLEGHNHKLYSQLDTDPNTSSQERDIDSRHQNTSR